MFDDDIPQSYIYKNLFLANSEWIRELVTEKKVPATFPVHDEWSDDDIQSFLKQSSLPKGVSSAHWQLLEFDLYPRRPQLQVCPLPPFCDKNETTKNCCCCFSEILEHVSRSNFTNSWRDSFKTYGQAYVHQISFNVGPQSAKMDHDQVLFQIIRRLFDCPIILCDDQFQPMAATREPRHVCRAIACVITDKEVVLLRPHRPITVHHVQRFSPAILETSHMKPLFLTFQILQAMADVHELGLTVGDVTLHDILLDQDFMVNLKPHIASNLLLLYDDDEHEEDNKESCENCDDQEHENNILGTAVEMWSAGHLSNFDYIMLLNHLSGRSFDNPNHYPVMPWVKDFTSKFGGWRDLSKSKYRLNKGDTQLDLTYENKTLQSDDCDVMMHHNRSLLHVPHHVSDVLSEITYYVYKARTTPRSVLCRHVRNRWVPAEYPSSMARLMEWTPDECIPDFFTDPTLFRSLHEDLQDLELPSWCSKSPEEFVQWHMNALESVHVSERLHMWIDLTFGYKLSGSSAVRAKNVCLHLVDSHVDLRTAGVVQLFTHPHPTKGTKGAAFWDKKRPPDISTSDSEEEEAFSLNDEPVLGSGKHLISLPKNYDPVSALADLEQLNSFMLKSNTEGQSSTGTKKENSCKKNLLCKMLATKRLVRDMQVMGCLIMELFMPKKFMSLDKSAGLKTRMELSQCMLANEEHNVPLVIRATVKTLLCHSSFKSTHEDRYPMISEDGLPPPSARQLLTPELSKLSFPDYFATYSRVIQAMHDMNVCLLEARLKTAVVEEKVEEKVGEVKVKAVASELLPLLDNKLLDLSLILPTLKRLFMHRSTAIMTAWFLFEPTARILGPCQSVVHLLPAMVNIYETNSQTSSKHLKLYHRTFLRNVMVRFGIKVFLKYFTENLIEAVGGYEDFDLPNNSSSTASRRQGLEREWTTKENTSPAKTPQDDLLANRTAPNTAGEFSEGEVFAFDNEDVVDEKTLEGVAGESKEKLYTDIIHVPSPYDIDWDSLNQEANKCGSTSKNKLSEGNISQVAAESVIWLAHRLGPVLSAKYLSKNLLKMLNLCYSNSNSSRRENSDVVVIKVSSQSGSRTRGDDLAHNVLECLTELASIYGENFILLQYLPYAWDLIALAKKRMTPNLEGGLIGCVTMTHHMIPYLSDSVLMNELTDNLMNRLLFPVLQISTSRSLCFAGGWRPRQLLLDKLLDVTYLIGLRIGEEMARTHLSGLCSAFFSAFEKVYQPNGQQFLVLQQQQDTSYEELKAVLTSDLAYTCYVAFYHLMGRAHLDQVVPNLDLIRMLCSKVGQEKINSLQPATFAHLRNSSSEMPKEEEEEGEEEEDHHASSGGNKIMPTTHHRPSSGIHGLIKKEMKNTSRHLRGNWLAYWEHEIGRSDRDTGLNVKQIRLQSFTGHTAGIKSMFVLDNENSFLSASRDKTVKVWSLRSQGDGSCSSSPQWSYGLHKKSVMNVFFLHALHLAVSCDSNVHVWDPFVGTCVHQVDPARLGPVSVMTTLRQPSNCVVAATHHDSLLHIVDCRVGAVTSDLKVCLGSAGLVRCLSADLDGYTVTIGHSSGFLSQLDIRTGKLRQAWKGHEGEILTLTPLSTSEFATTSLDQTMSVWTCVDGKIKCCLPGAQEPVHCVAVYDDGEQMVTASTGNRIGVRRGHAADSPHTSNRLRADILKGNLACMRLLPMNRLLLLGQDTGTIRLIC